MPNLHWKHVLTRHTDTSNQTHWNWRESKKLGILPSFACFRLTWPRIHWKGSVHNFDYFDSLSHINKMCKEIFVNFSECANERFVSTHMETECEREREKANGACVGQRSWQLCNYRECSTSISMQREEKRQWWYSDNVLCLCMNVKCNKKSRQSWYDISRQIHLSNQA